MQTYSDSIGGLRSETEPTYLIPPVELMPLPVVAERVYERNSIADILQTMFREADERAAMGIIDEPLFERDSRPGMSTPEAYRSFLTSIQTKLKESDAVHHLQETVRSGETLSEHDIEAVFRAYERAMHEALHKLRDQLTPEQLHHLQYAATSELDWSLRDMITQHVVASAESDVDLRYDPADFFLLLNPKARKIEYMESGEILTTLRRSMSRASKDQLKRDLDIVHRAEAVPAVQELRQSQDFSTVEDSIH